MTAGSRALLQDGVTLTELAVIGAVIAVLVAIGIPSYRHHVLRVKSVDAIRELRTLALRLEGCRSRTGSYTRLDDVPNACVRLPYAIPEGTYRISGDIVADAFLLTATPIGSQVADTHCSAFTLDHLHQQGITGTGTAPGCWGDRLK
ncbi:MAG: type IV pilin protein [Pseudomonadota bacterium]